MSTLVMVRTVCCESYKCTGERCSICPHLPENMEAVLRYQRAVANRSLGRMRTVMAEQAMEQRPASNAATTGS